MYQFKKDLTCSKCGCDEYKLFVDENGQGIRCIECLHEKVVCKPQTKSHKKRFKVRMAEAWQAEQDSNGGTF